MSPAPEHRHRRKAQPNYLLRRSVACLMLVALIAIIAVVVLNLFKNSPLAPVAIKATSTTSTSTTTTFPPPSSIAIAHWPLGLAAAFSAPSAGVIGTNYHANALSIASLTKMMTAIIVEHRLPLGVSGDGPSWTVTPQDLTTTAELAHINGITIPVTSGERLSERLLLEGLLVHSANNYAMMLSELCHMSVHGFVNAMSQEAQALGMTQTFYVDPSGISPANRSTPADQVLVAQELERYPLLAKIVTMTSVQVPGVGREPSYTPLVGTHGVIGVKSGTLAAAGASDALAINPIIHGVATPIYVAVLHVTGYPNITIAGNVALEIAHEVAHYLDHS